MEKFAFIGDIHGAVVPMREVINRALGEAEVLVFLGDYVNRGPQSRDVIEALINLSVDVGDRVHYLRGHHDAAFLRAIEQGRIDAFLRMGGAATLSNYPRCKSDGSILPLVQRIPRRHLQFLRSLEPSFVSGDCVAMHYKFDAQPVHANKFGVFGHQPQLSRVPLVTQNFALIDTGCGTFPDGRLSCFLWPSRRWFQAS
ncbi:metallophosphoesterase [Nocardia sp. CA-120079]|uniref:metallophosphoesterase n=1 Tax=Nocardia sp. CA-120079 TaxID=3239974 RepID=UPI003D970580